MGVFLSVPYYQQMSQADKTPIYTVSGAGSSIVNGDYYLWQLGIWKHLSNNIYMGANGAFGSFGAVIIITTDNSMPVHTDSSVYYYWEATTGVPQLPIPIAGNQTVGAAGSSPFPAIADY